MERVNAYLGDHTYLTQLKAGPKILLDTRELSMTAHIIADGCWESWITNIYTECIQPGMTVLDIGANCGYYSLLAAQLTGPLGHVHAFEPNPFHHPNLTKSKWVNGFYHLDIHRCALSNENGEMLLYAPEQSTASASLHKEMIHPLPYMDSIQPVKVKAVRLHDYLPHVKANIIKMDIEGSEPLILDDILEVMERSGDSKLFMEYNQKAWQQLGHDCETILNNIVKRHFDIYIIRHDSSLEHVTPQQLIQMTNGKTHFDLFITRNP